MVKYDISSNSIIEQPILNQLDGQISFCSDIQDVSLYLLTDSSFVVLTTYENNYYIDLYQNDGVHLASNKIEHDGSGEKVVCLTSEEKMILGADTTLYTIDFSDGVQYTKTDGASDVYGVSTILSLDENRMLVLGYDTFEMWENGTVTKLALSDE